ncbi:VOC family protein [Candidatus Berkelbacteria bacterium]|nr:VOC family protein [Candidatus Berkelbacteria bacterium]
MDPVVHFEMPAEDNARVSEFYAAAFGWKMQPMGEQMGNYVLAITTEVDDKTQRPKTPGAINGGFFNRQKPNQAPHLVISVDDLAASVKKVKAAGGSIISGPMDIPGVGSFVMFTDTEGNPVGMLQPAPMENKES